MSFPYQQKLNIRPRNLIFYGLTFTALILVYVELAEIENARLVFLRSNYYWLSCAALIQILGTYFLALNYRDILKIKKLSLPLKILFPLTFIIQFLNQALPSATVSGQVFFVQYLKNYGLSINEGISRAILETTTLFSAFGILFFTSFIFLFRHGVFDRYWEIRFVVYLFLLVSISALLIFYAIQTRARNRVIKWLTLKISSHFEKNTDKIKSEEPSHMQLLFYEVQKTLSIAELRKSGTLFGRAIVWQVLTLLADVATLYLLPFALGAHISFSIIFIVFILTKFISMIAFIPGALGIFEGSMTIMFISFGVPTYIALSTTLLFRVFTFWLPMPIGWFLYRRYLKTYTEKQKII